MRRISLGVVAAFAAAAHCLGQSAEEIMAKVAENQQRAVELRSAFVYRQNVLVRMKRGNGRLAREEQGNYVVTPTPQGFRRTLESFAGKYEKDGKYFEYTKPHHQYKDVDIDGDLASDLADEVAGERNTRDGIGHSLFPLTPERQKRYTFRLEGLEEYNGREVYRLTFKPRDGNEGGFWGGEVLVEAREYQPVLVTTHMARGVPFLVRTMLGTNLHYLGFKVAYDRFAEGVWFPVRYGGEFELRAVFFYKRKIAVSAVNSGFQRAEADSRVTYDVPGEGAGGPGL
jgi:hypothetical protein